jgi:hypothetical protein
MEKFELTRLGPVEFERLVRALCFQVMGPAGVVFSAGPDGGRDFTYEGAIKGYESQKWKGYLVVQAKFRDATNSADDLEWLKKQIQKEFNKFKKAGQARLPDYYILATNVRLSGSDGRSGQGNRSRTGGYSKTLDLFGAWKKELNLKQVDIWPYDKIIDLLISQPEIRHAYAAWITPGDVLTKVFEQFSALRPDFKEVMSRSLRVFLHKDQYVRLKDAGSVGDVQIRTSQVFVDIPLVQTAQQKRLSAELRRTGDVDESNAHRKQIMAISALVERSREKLDPETLLQEDEVLGKDERKAQPNRVVLIGGPGQGKSTASLFLAQIFRSAILEKHPATRRDQNVKHLVPEILERAGLENISRAIPHRYPLHISLPRFADTISGARLRDETPPSLLTHITKEISSSCDQDIDRSDVRNWLRAHPWILVLDGLDEVPPSGERPAILEAISNFFMEVSEVNADVLVIVTTRPQGYNKDFDEKVWQHWKLADLNSEQALNYALAFGLARYPDDRLRREEVHALLKKATNQPATSRLMVSPLQVTILHFIVDTGGGVPTARWTLFNEYFEVLKRREKAKGGETQKILERYWQHLGPIHHRAGLVLQTDSEHVGGAGSRFTHDRFRSLIKAYLASEGHSHDEVERRVGELMGVALHRLVLLSTQEEGTITFDVRSLQEFMAAAALTSEDQPVMESRLAHIAGHSHWRHVFQIAASRCFADDSFHYRRAAIIAIPRQIDSVEPDMLGRNGARLALDLLADGIGLDHPNSRRPLLQHALEELALGREAIDLRLSEVWDDQTIDLAQQTLARNINNGTTEEAIASWHLLLRLEQLGYDWAYDLIQINWPRDPELLISILEGARPPFANQGLVDLIYTALISIGPSVVYGKFFRLFRPLHSDDLDNLDYSFLKSIGLSRRLFGSTNESGARNSRLTVLENSPGTTISFLSVDGKKEFEHFARAEFLHPMWAPFRAANHFASNPTTETLANALSTMTDCDVNDLKLLRGQLPWPIASIIDELAESSELEEKARQVRSGEKGDEIKWRAAEERWYKEGVRRADLEVGTTGAWFDCRIADVGAPFFVLTGGFGGNRNSSEIIDSASQLLSLCQGIKIESIRQTIAQVAEHFLLSAGSARSSKQHVRLLLTALAITQSDLFDVGLLGALPKDDWKDKQLAQLLSHAVTHTDRLDTEFSDVSSVLRTAFEFHPDMRELLFPLAHTILESEQTSVDILRSIPGSAFVAMEGDTPRARIASVVLSLAASKATANDVLHSPEWNAQDPALVALLGALLKNEILPLDKRILMLVELIKSSNKLGSGSWRTYIEALHRALDTRKSGLLLKEIWVDKLKLPEDSFSILLPANEKISTPSAS